MKKILNIFLKQFKSLIFLIVILMILGLFLEVFSLALLYPLFDLFFKPELPSKVFESINQILFISNNWKAQLYITTTFTIFIFLGKNLYYLWLNKKQFRLISYLYEFILNNFYRNFFSLRYQEFIKKSKPDFLKLFQQDIIIMVNYFQSGLIVITEFSFLIIIFIFITYIDVLTSIIVACFSIFIFSVYRFILQPRIVNAGAQRDNVTLENYYYVENTLNNAKAIFASNKSKNVIELFKSQSKNISEIYFRFNFIAHLPKNFIEISFIILALSIYCILLYFSYSFNEILKIIAVLLGGFFRIMPSVNKILFNLSNINYGKETVDSLIKNIKIFIPEENKILKATANSLLIQKLNFSYGDKKIFENANISFEKGSIIGIKGESGIGKSTFTDILSGLLEPASMDLFVDDKKLNYKKYKLQIGYVTQNGLIIEGASIAENICFKFNSQEIDKLKLNEAIKKSSLSNFINSLPLKENTILGADSLKLSGGQLQRLLIARTLYEKNDILIFDESTNSLDSKTKRDVLNNIEKLKKDHIIIFISHDQDALKITDKVLEIKNHSFLKVL